jgi:hypothetical protein
MILGAGRRRLASLVLAGALGVSGAAYAAEVPDAELYPYHTRAGDTLIGLAQRVLVDPRRWPDLQALNHVERTRQIPTGSLLNIPYRWLRLSPEQAEVLRAAGDARINGAPLAGGARISAGAVIETGATGSATIAMPDGSVVTVQRDSRLEVGRLQRIDGLDAHDASFRLTAGRAETRVQPQHDVGRFEIRTPVAVSAVRGTRFRAAFDPADADARTETLEGVVGVGASGASVAVGAGFGTRVEKDAPPSAPLPLPPAPDLNGLPSRSASPDVEVAFAAVPAAARYRLQLADDEAFYTVLRDEILAGPGATLKGLADGHYWLKLRSITAQGLEGPDAVRDFTVRRAPAAPLPIAPPAGANVAGTGTALRFAAVPDAIAYEIDVARDESFTEPLRRRSLKPELEADGLAPGVYFWRVAAENESGDRGAWSEPRRFTVRRPAPVAEVRTVRRESSTIGWQPTGAATYRVEIARDRDFARPVRAATVSEPAWNTGSLFGGRYYVRVRGIDSDGYETPPGPVAALDAPRSPWLGFAVALTAVLSFF